MNLKFIAIVLFFVMFIYSGVNKLSGFNKKVKILEKKTGLPHIINLLGMTAVILLEVFGSLIMISHFMMRNLINIQYIKYVNLLFLAFLIVVTFLYHPPTDKLIPFLSNMTTFGGLLYIYADL
tara:strand:- start:172 stop:540 length:369 start_codon:yes stop_codon:yes gene_type:complete